MAANAYGKAARLISDHFHRWLLNFSVRHSLFRPNWRSSVQHNYLKGTPPTPNWVPLDQQRSLRGTPRRRSPPPGRPCKHDFAIYSGNEGPHNNKHRRICNRRDHCRGRYYSDRADLVATVRGADPTSSYEEEKAFLVLLLSHGAHINMLSQRDSAYSYSEWRTSHPDYLPAVGQQERLYHPHLDPRSKRAYQKIWFTRHTRMDVLCSWRLYGKYMAKCIIWDACTVNRQIHDLCQLTVVPFHY